MHPIVGIPSESGDGCILRSLRSTEFTPRFVLLEIPDRDRPTRGRGGDDVGYLRVPCHSCDFGGWMSRIGFGGDGDGGLVGVVEGGYEDFAIGASRGEEVGGVGVGVELECGYGASRRPLDGGE